MSGQLRRVLLCALDDLPKGGALGFDPENTGRNTLFLVRTETSVYGFSDICPHYGSTSLPWRKNDYLSPCGKMILCAAHGAEFELTTGLCVSGPCLGKSLTQIPLTTSKESIIFAEISDQ